MNLASSSSSRISFMAITTPDVARPPPSVADIASEASSVSAADDCRAADALKWLKPWPNRGAFGRACRTLYTVP